MHSSVFQVNGRKVFAVLGRTIGRCNECKFKMRREEVEPPPLAGQDPKSCASGRLSLILLNYCGEQELNLQGLPHKILSLARLPIPPPPQKRGAVAVRGFH